MNAHDLLRRTPPHRPTLVLAAGFLLNPYLLANYWFEVFECVRKIALVGFPVFFVGSSLEQLMLGLIVCFITFGVFMWFKPYRDPSDNMLQMLCQISIFFSLLSKVVLDHPDVSDSQSSMLGARLALAPPRLPSVAHCAALAPTQAFCWSS